MKFLLVPAMLFFIAGTASAEAPIRQEAKAFLLQARSPGGQALAEKKYGKSCGPVYGNFQIQVDAFEKQYGKSSKKGMSNEKFKELKKIQEEQLLQSAMNVVAVCQKKK